jgi:HTH-type transcriptional regulator / antitoxin HipB
MEYLVYTTSQLAAAAKSRRKTSGMTQAEVASRVGLLPKTVSAIETRPEVVSVDSLFRLIAALDLELVLRAKGETVRDATREAW